MVIADESWRNHGIVGHRVDAQNEVPDPEGRLRRYSVDEEAEEPVSVVIIVTMMIIIIMIMIDKEEEEEEEEDKDSDEVRTIGW